MLKENNNTSHLRFIVEQNRRSGRTTRLCDQSIQELFNIGKVKIFDHTRHTESNKHLIKMICNRLDNEHRHVEYDVDIKQLIIKLKE